VRGVSKNVLQIRNKVKIVQGRMFQPGLDEVWWEKMPYFLLGLTVGNTINLGTCAGKWWGIRRGREFV